ncbi:uncharacterized protein LOC110058722 [Orbicella faveolata]|uniref:uncharacterized protein LOC110058722 n=1 Tax=Orbicella faveolata TaxID=48498 RepID=UPI0009E1CD64|nr:uncharacterized protein LOC110058722 [Orbicella faveolata]
MRNFLSYRMFLLLSYFLVIFDNVNNVFVFLLLAVPEPVALYPLNTPYKAAEKQNRQPKGILGDVAITNGPYNEPGGAYMFYGIVSSYIEFPNTGGLDTRFSITLMCWVRPGGQDGPLFSYGKDGRGVQIWIDRGRFNLSLSDLPASGLLSSEVLPTGVWVHVAATYNYHIRISSLFINGHLNVSNRIRRRYAVATNADKVRMGVRVNDNRYFKGKVAEMKVYDVALNEAQIQTSIRQVPPMVTFPAALLAIQGGMLSCSARGTPPIYTALIRNSTVLVNTTNTATIRLDKDGNYTCQAINQYGTDVKELQVNFTSKRFLSGLNTLFLSSTVQCLRVTGKLRENAL